MHQDVTENTSGRSTNYIEDADPTTSRMKFQQLRGRKIDPSPIFSLQFTKNLQTSKYFALKYAIFSIQSHIFVTIIKIIYTNMAFYGILWQLSKNCHIFILLLIKYLQQNMTIWQFFFKKLFHARQK